MKAQLIYNPVAGPRAMDAEVSEVMAFLRSHGWEVTLRRTLGPGDATTYAREAVANHCDVAVAIGGDGTLGEVATGLAHSNCAMGVLPAGTGNVWAHMFRLPIWTPRSRSALLDAARILLEGQVREVDLGKAGERYFLLWTGIGFDAQVAREIEPYREVRRNLGNLTYYITALAMSVGLRGTRMTVVIDGRAIRQRVLLILVTNVQLYASSWRLAPQAQLDDGLLEVYIFKGDNMLDGIRHAIHLGAGQHLRDPKVEAFRGKRVEVRGEKPLPLHMDGDPVGHTPVTITVAPKALRVIVPSWSSGSLFEGDHEATEELPLARRIAQRLRYERERAQEFGEGQQVRSER